MVECFRLLWVGGCRAPISVLSRRHPAGFMLMLTCACWFFIAFTATSNNARQLFDLAESNELLGYTPVDDYDVFAASLLV